jgi:hypothetical protein
MSDETAEPQPQEPPQQAIPKAPKAPPIPPPRQDPGEHIRESGPLPEAMEPPEQATESRG